MDRKRSTISRTLRNYFPEFTVEAANSLTGRSRQTPTLASERIGGLSTKSCSTRSPATALILRSGKSSTMIRAIGDSARRGSIRDLEEHDCPTGVAGFVAALRDSEVFAGAEVSIAL